MSLAIGFGHAVFCVAEIGVCHNGSLDTALQLVDAAARSGVQACKVQVWAERDDDSYPHLRLGRADLLAIQHATQAAGLTFFATPDDLPSVDLLEAMGVELYKVGSAGLANPALLRRIGETNKQFLMSTGMADLSEIARAITLIGTSRTYGYFGPKPILLHCVSGYPTPADQVNLRRMTVLRERTGWRGWGYSSHYPGIEDAIVAVAMGAVVIEKHITLDCNQPGPDHSSSLTPADFAEMVRTVRNVEMMMGDGRIGPQACEAQLRREVWGE